MFFYRSKARERLGDHSGTKELEGDKSDESKEKNKSDSGTRMYYLNRISGPVRM